MSSNKGTLGNWSSGLFVDQLELACWGVLRPDVLRQVQGIALAMKAVRRFGAKAERTGARFVADGRTMGVVGVGSNGQLVVSNRWFKMEIFKGIRPADVLSGNGTPCVRLDFASWALRARHYQELADEILEWVKGLFVISGPVRVARLDLAVDQVSDEPTVLWETRSQFVTRCGYGSFFDDGSTSFNRGRRLTGFGIGKRGATYCRIYDKIFELRGAPSFWWDVWRGWGLPDIPPKGSSIWRTEFEMRSKRLKKLGVREWPALKEQGIFGLWGWATCRPFGPLRLVYNRGEHVKTAIAENVEGFVRVVEHGQTRRRDAQVLDFWKTLWSKTEARSVSVRSAPEVSAEMLYRQGLGTLVTAAVHEGCPPRMFRARLDEIINSQGGLDFISQEMFKRVGKEPDRFLERGLNDKAN